jgi:putative transposase
MIPDICLPCFCDGNIFYTSRRHWLPSVVASRLRMGLSARERASMKRHSPEEIRTKLRHAQDLENRGQSQGQICKALGISVMTFHRWRKGAEQLPDVASSTTINDEKIRNGEFGNSKRVSEVLLENRRLRKIVTDLLLEKLKLEESVAVAKARKDPKRDSI